MILMSIGLLMSEGRKYLIVRDESRSNDQMSPASSPNLSRVPPWAIMPKCGGPELGRKCDPLRGNSQCLQWVKNKDTGKKYSVCKCKKIRAANPKRPKGKCGHAYY